MNLENGLRRIKRQVQEHRIINIETLPYHNYVIIERRPSRIDPGAMIDEEVGMRCPRCKHQQPPMEHGEARICQGCDLPMWLHGNGLKCASR